MRDDERSDFNVSHKVEENKIIIRVQSKRKNNIYSQINLDLPSSIINVKAEVINGDITAEEMNVEAVKLTSTNGDVMIRKLHFLEAELTSTNGDISAKLMNDKYNIQYKTINGDTSCRINNQPDGKKLICKTTNGDISIH